MIDSLEIAGNIANEIVNPDKKSFFLEYKEILIAITPIIAVLLTAIFSFRTSIRSIKNSQQAQSNFFNHEIDKLKMSILTDNYKKLYKSKLECAETLQYLAYKVILVKSISNYPIDNQYDERPDIERSTYDFHRAYLNLYLKYSIVFGDETFQKMTDLKLLMDNIIEDLSNNQGTGFLSDGERVRKITLDLITAIRNDLLLDNNLLRTLEKKTN